MMSADNDKLMKKAAKALRCALVIWHKQRGRETCGWLMEPSCLLDIWRRDWSRVTAATIMDAERHARG
jgi:hypothetical protein